MRELMKKIEGIPITSYITIQRKTDILDIVNDKWMYFHSPVHAAAYALDPEFLCELNDAPPEVFEGSQLVLDLS